MKQEYTNPALRTVKMQTSAIICGSDWDKMGQGENNQPAGSRRFGGFAWDEMEDIED